MILRFKFMLGMSFCVALILQVGGCIFVDHEHRHHDHPAQTVVYVH